MVPLLLTLAVEVSTISDAIRTVQPHVPEEKAVVYAEGVRGAWKKYGIEPIVLVAIAHQESSFRENLPEGRAGEIGLCQIRKRWLTHEGFRREFRGATLKDLRNPVTNLMMAAWILKDLKDRNARKPGLPYWSLYNSRRIEKRFAYFLRVNARLLEPLYPYQPLDWGLPPRVAASRSIVLP